MRWMPVSKAMAPPSAAVTPVRPMGWHRQGLSERDQGAAGDDGEAEPLAPILASGGLLAVPFALLLQVPVESLFGWIAAQIPVQPHKCSAFGLRGVAVRM